MEQLVDKLHINEDLPDNELKMLIENGMFERELFHKADEVRRRYYGTDVYIRGLIEVSNYCKNDCYYCGIRSGNMKLERYRLDDRQILACCHEGYELGFRTFVLQGGEDVLFSDKHICGLVSQIRALYHDCAITLSLGEKSRDSYKAYYEAGANRYLLRHETASAGHYKMLHPVNMSLENRKECLYYLKELGYEVGTGFMVGSPFQTTEYLIEDLRFLQELGPDMIGIGPFISHRDTPFNSFKSGDLHLCLRLIAILRLMFPYALIPATTSLGTVAGDGRELGLLAGANVVMPNLSPVSVRKLYELYDDKICTGEEAAECRMCLEAKVNSVGYNIVIDRGDVKRRAAA
ncbi:MAG: [FeFe] hydrogenase H-cluster radical SAM maturase HydE [Deltaproteobacteria bacterium]|nr:[FeFe] hydrogenase H-cluster radical SAM maturase HydE [Deltaproteobacteria bacterium]